MRGSALASNLSPLNAKGYQYDTAHCSVSECFTISKSRQKSVDEHSQEWMAGDWQWCKSYKFLDLWFWRVLSSDAQGIWGPLSQAGGSVLGPEKATLLRLCMSGSGQSATLWCSLDLMVLEFQLGLVIYKICGSTIVLDGFNFQLLVLFNF